MDGRGAVSATSSVAAVQSVSDARNFEQVKQYAAQKGITVDDSLSAFYFDGIKLAVEGMARVADEKLDAYKV